jgi:hypothetical protein
MTTLTKTYPTDVAARRAVETLRATGVPDRDLRLLAGSAPRDIRHEQVGGFAGPVAPDAPVGPYGGRVVRRRQGAGSFAGDPDQQRQGSFADTDRLLIVTYTSDTERARITGLRDARRLLRRAALDDDAIDARSASCTRDTRSSSSISARSPQAKPTRASRNSRAPPERVRRARSPRSARGGVRRGAAAPTPARGRAPVPGTCFHSVSRSPRRDEPRCCCGRRLSHKAVLEKPWRARGEAR